MQTQNIVETTTLKMPNELKLEEWSDIGNPNEIWKPIKEYEGLYEVSNMGRIKTLNRKFSDNRDRIIEERILNSYVNKNNDYDYYRIILTKNGKNKKFLTHRLVAISFIENPNNFPCVNHKNLNKLDNRAENLEWMTHKQNSQHAVKHGKFIAGENHHTTHLNKDTVDLIRLMYISGNKDSKEICELYDISHGTLRLIIDNNTWKDEEYQILINSQLFKKRQWLTRKNLGVSNCNGKLNNEKVKTIRELYEHWDYSCLKLGRLFDVGKSTILSIIHRNTWKHI